MPIVHQCANSECATLTIGELCIEHEVARGPLVSITDELTRAVILTSGPPIEDAARSHPVSSGLAA